MNTESSIDSEPDVAGADGPDDGQPPNSTNGPTNGPTNGGVSERKRTANRNNSQKSTGPTSEMGKRIASQNSFKNGYYSSERRRQLMANSTKIRRSANDCARTFTTPTPLAHLWRASSSTASPTTSGSAANSTASMPP
jgi:hypothetical protein